MGTSVGLAAYGLHTRLLVAVGGTISGYPMPQTVMGKQLLSANGWQATDKYWKLPQVWQATQTEFWLPRQVPDFAVKPELQIVQFEQARSDVTVGAVVWYWRKEQSESDWQTRLLVSVGAAIWNCVDEQDGVTAEQTRSDVAVGAAVWYVEPATQAVHGVHVLWPLDGWN